MKIVNHEQGAEESLRDSTPGFQFLLGLVVVLVCGVRNAAAGAAPPAGAKQVLMSKNVDPRRPGHVSPRTYADAVASYEAASVPTRCRPQYRDQSSRPGTPCLPPAPRPYPYTSETAWRVELGERVLRAVTPLGNLGNCGAQQEQGTGQGFKLFGDSTWCEKAVKVSAETRRRIPDLVGLSFGIEERDLWSEKMSTWFEVPTMLFDCYQDPARSPALAGKAPNATKACGEDAGHCYSTAYYPNRLCLGDDYYSSTADVANANGANAKKEKKKRNDVAHQEQEDLSNKIKSTTRARDGATSTSEEAVESEVRDGYATETLVKDQDLKADPKRSRRKLMQYGDRDKFPLVHNGGRRFTTLMPLLWRQKSPLSVFLKIDVEGSEWTPLERLLEPENAAQVAKIRTLDMEVHFGWGRDKQSASFYEEARRSSGDGKAKVEQDEYLPDVYFWIAREVGILEKLREKFFVTGSTLEVYREGWHPEKDCAPPSRCPEPVIHLAGGMGVAAFAVSYVNKDLVGRA
eukprot:g6841.t1